MSYIWKIFRNWTPEIFIFLVYELVYEELSDCFLNVISEHFNRISPIQEKRRKQNTEMNVLEEEA